MSKLIIPNGKKTGCLPRTSRPGEVCPLFREYIDVIPQEEWKEYVGKIDLRDHVNHIKDQDGVGSCATESTAQGVEVSRDFAGFEWVRLNPWFIYYHTSGGTDRGSSIDDNLRFVRENGVVPESVWPRSKGWRTKPSEEAYEAALNFTIEEFFDLSSIAEAGTALLKGFPVVFGWEGHSVLYTSVITRRKGEYANSWDSDWGDEGFGELAFSEVNWQYGAFAIRTVKVHEG